MGNDIKGSLPPTRKFHPTKPSAEVEARAAAVNAETYIVKDGDALWRIAKRNKMSLEKLAKFNNLEDPNSIFVGQKIFIPPPEPNEGWSAPAAAAFLNGAKPQNRPQQTAVGGTAPVKEAETPEPTVLQKAREAEGYLITYKKNVAELKLAMNAREPDTSKLPPDVAERLNKRLATLKKLVAEGKKPGNPDAEKIGAQVNELARLMLEEGAVSPEQLYKVVRSSEDIKAELKQYAQEIPQIEAARDELISQLSKEDALQFILFNFPFEYVDDATTNDKIIPQMLKYLTALDSAFDDGVVKSAVAATLKSLSEIQPDDKQPGQLEREHQRLEEVRKQLTKWVERN